MASPSNNIRRTAEEAVSQQQQLVIKLQEEVAILTARALGLLKLCMK